MGVRRFNDPNTGRWAPVLTHINAVIGWDNKSLSTILEEIISRVDDKEAENADDIEVWQMESGKVYVKDGKLYICITSNGSDTQDYQAITVGTDGLKVIGYDSTSNPPNYVRDVYDNDSDIHIANNDADFKNRAPNIGGIWFIGGNYSEINTPDSVPNNYSEVAKIAFFTNVVTVYERPSRFVVAICFNGDTLYGTVQLVNATETWAWVTDSDDNIWMEGWGQQLNTVAIDGSNITVANGVADIPLATPNASGAMSSSDKTLINKFLRLLGGGADNYDLSDMGQNLDVTGSYDGNNNLLNYYAAITDDSENAGIVISTTSKTSTPSASSKQLLISPSGIYFRKGTSSNNWGDWELVGGGISAADKIKLDGIEAGAQVNSIERIRWGNQGALNITNDGSIFLPLDGVMYGNTGTESLATYEAVTAMLANKADKTVVTTSANGLMSIDDKGRLEQVVYDFHAISGDLKDYRVSYLSLPPVAFIGSSAILKGTGKWAHYFGKASEYGLVFTIKDADTTWSDVTQVKLGSDGWYKRTGEAVTTWSEWTPLVPNSVVLTGTPTAPTATAGTNTTQIATTAYVQGELANRYPMVTLTESAYQDLVDDDEVDPNVLYVIVDNT